MHHKNNKRDCHAHHRCCGIVADTRWNRSVFMIGFHLKQLICTKSFTKSQTEKFSEKLSPRRNLVLFLTHTVAFKDFTEAGLNDLKLAGSAFLTVSSTIDCAFSVLTPGLALAANLNFAIAFPAAS